MRTVGKVKWFDAATGEGCALSDSGGQAAFTRALLGPFGLAAVDAGAALVYDVRVEAGRLIVGAIHEISGKGPQSMPARPPAATPPPLRVKGCVQWFDSERGYGFVVSKDVYGDVLLHRSMLEAIGVESLRVGAVLDVDVILKVKGYHVHRIHAVLAPDVPLSPPVVPPFTGGRIVIGTSGGLVDFGGIKARRALWFAPSKGFLEAGVDDPPWQDAVCKWFSRPKGYGFAEPVGGGDDIFVHMDVLRRCGLSELRKGQRVRVRSSEDERGFAATEIELDEDDDDA